MAGRLVWERLPFDLGLWLVRDATKDGSPVGLVVEQMSSPRVRTYDVVELCGMKFWASRGHLTLVAAVTELAAFLVEHGL